MVSEEKCLTAKKREREKKERIRTLMNVLGFVMWSDEKKPVALMAATGGELE